MTPSRTFEAEAPLSAFALAPAGTEIAAALKNGTLQVWSTAGRPLRSWPAGDRPPGFMAFTGDGRRILAVAGHWLEVFDAGSGGRLAAWEAHRKDIESAACSRDGSLLASASDDGTVRLWKADGSPLRTIAGGLGEMLGVAVSPGGERVAGGAGDAVLRLASVETGAIEHALELPMACPVLTFSPDGRTLAAGSVDGTVTLWDAASGAPKGTLGRYRVPVGAAVFSADGQRLASTSLSMNPSTAEAEARVWDLATGRETSTPIGISSWNTVGFAPSGQPLAFGIHERTISVWEL